MSSQATASTHSSRSETTDSETGLTVAAVDTIREIDRDRWNEVVERADLGTVFHRYEWLAAVELGIGHPARHLLVEKDSNLIGVVPNFVVPIPKTPFSRLTSIYPGFGGPLLTTDVDDSLSLVLETIPDCCSRRTIVHGIRACNTNFLRYDGALSGAGYESNRVGGRFVLPLSNGYDAVFDGMDSSKRRAIRRGRETDHDIVEAELTHQELTRFYERYRQHMESVGGHVYPRAFFEQLREMEDRILLAQLYVEGEYAGGFLELLNDERNTVHGFFAAIPPAYFEYYASERLYDYVFQWAIENGYEAYDFGGGGADFRDGAFTFKEEFGGELVPNVYWERGTNPVWPLVRRGRSLYQRFDGV
ncbi:hypothetical protein C482_19416 [Natrialba chahannaoensis JCM 10990]|uniref:BioF2-like acetyltransferase domain-containing protein n=1 Tax=Natrialba chahannaoensis JCM 10990 TaxID=1227492 RepID=M0A330_9EURY|nr:GNAT family N-acetyltransferase [Natrialba chahannaoensis]ELY93175.1 hypothetical protein C482_19416 [Natrialba chahannaoensis JCM 10990]